MIVRYEWEIGVWFAVIVSIILFTGYYMYYAFAVMEMEMENMEGMENHDHKGLNEIMPIMIDAWETSKRFK